MPIDDDLARAAVDTGFALLDLAEDESLFGTQACARRALDEAGTACADAEHMLKRLEAPAFRNLEPQVVRLHSAIEGMRPRFTA